MVELIRRELGRSDLWLPPGTAFGALHGKLAVEPGDVVMALGMYWSDAFADRLAAAGLFPGVQYGVAKLRYRHRRYTFRVPEFVRTGRLAPTAYAVWDRCEACGLERIDEYRGRPRLGEPLFPQSLQRPLLPPPGPVLLAASLPTDTDACKMAPGPYSATLVSTRFRELVERWAPGCLEFVAVELV